MQASASTATEDILPPAAASDVASGEARASFTVEGIDNLTDDEERHKTRFYELLYPMVEKFKHESYSAKFIFRDKYDKIHHICSQIEAGVSENDLVKQGYGRKVYNWNKTYALHHFGTSSRVVLHEVGVSLADLKSLSYYERCFCDLLEIHKSASHQKGRKFARRVKTKYSNLSEVYCKLFTDTCLTCHPRNKEKKPTAEVDEDKAFADEPSRKRPIGESILPEKHNEELMERLKKLILYWADEVRMYKSIFILFIVKIYLSPVVVITGTNEREPCIL
jgi:rubrerythrin